MNEYNIKLYQKEDYAVWNAFVSTAKNATFLFHRDFMEYHSDRFEDHSLMVFSKENLIAILPANRVGDTLFSHQGLTYGGIVINEKMKLINYISLFKNILKYLNENKISLLNIRPIPVFYCDFFSNEFEYCNYIVKANLVRRDSLSVINLSKPFKISKTRKESIRRGDKNKLIVKEDLNLKLFWEEILIPNLSLKHKVKPVHTIEEICLLQNRFPENIRHFNVFYNDKIVAGTTVFVSKNVAHPQYISGNSQKNELGSLDYLYNHLITNTFKDKKYFDFGISNENGGLNINEGLLFWKESFGAKCVSQDFYEVATDNYYLLENVFI